MLSLASSLWVRALSILSVASMTLAAASAVAQAPTQIPFQGMLLDAGGAPVTDVVDLDFGLHDAIVSGTLLWSESHVGVQVIDGIYSVNLGETAPITPAVLSGGSAFLEIVVDGETLTPRQQFRSVPYALVSDQLGGFSSRFYEEILEHFPLDGGDPPNLDPTEGLGDADGDGVPNFVDPDNDDDGISDVAELANGTDINLPSPSISSLSPGGTFPTLESISFSATGTNLEAIVSVQIGANTVTPSAVTATGFDFDFSSAAEGSFSVQAIASNGESATAPGVLVFENVVPTVSGVSPATNQPTFETISFTMTGQDLATATQVRIGTEVVTPYDVTATSLAFDFASSVAGALPVEVTIANGESATAPAALNFFDALPGISRLQPPVARDGEPTTITIRGFDFASSTGVLVDGNAITPTLVSDEELTVLVASPSFPVTTIELIHPSGNTLPASTDLLPVAAADARFVFRTET
ncbi:MAG: IPT/TIG domain-containing protein [Myxococcota bacterium]